MYFMMLHELIFVSERLKHRLIFLICRQTAPSLRNMYVIRWIRLYHGRYSKKPYAKLSYTPRSYSMCSYVRYFISIFNSIFRT
jgi:hypothetical protein